MQSFSCFSLPQAVLTNLTRIGLVSPTEIQSKTIPLALEGLDILGTSQTGTGKTAAYLLPLIVNCLNEDNMNALVLAPTRELAMQIESFFKKVVDRKSLRSALLIGGEPISKQISQLLCKPRVIIGTPGRIIDHLERETLKLNNTKFVVLDETDRMLDLGFGIQLDHLLKYLPKVRQTLMFSATLPEAIKSLTKKYLKSDVQNVNIGPTNKVVSSVKQNTIFTKDNEKLNHLHSEIEKQTGSVIIFVKTKILTEHIADKLQDLGHQAVAIHGDLRQRVRDRVLQSFRNKKQRVLVATDIAARGLDISHVECIINHDLPQSEEDFIHRIGRTGRAGAEGSSVTFLTPQDQIKWNRICKMLGVKDEVYPENPRNNSTRKPGANNFSSQKRDGRFKRSGDSYSEKPRTGFKSRSENKDFIFQEKSDRFKRSGDSYSEKPRTDFKKKPFSNDFPLARKEDRFKTRDDSYSKNPGTGFKSRSENKDFIFQEKPDRFKRSGDSFSEKPRTGFKSKSEDKDFIFQEKPDRFKRSGDSFSEKPRSDFKKKPFSNEFSAPKKTSFFKGKDDSFANKGTFKPRSPSRNSTPRSR